MLGTEAKSRQSGFSDDLDWSIDREAALWQPGWTHYGTIGQTPARLHTQTRVVEIKDRNEWIRCDSGADVFFTPDAVTS